MTSTEFPLSTLLVGISNPATMRSLVDVAVGIQRVTNCEVVISHVVTVRAHMNLRSARTSPEVVAAQELLSEALEYAANMGVSARAVVEVGRQVDQGLINATQTHDADAVLLGFSEQEGDGTGPGSRRFDRLTHRVSRGIQAHLLVARLKGTATYPVLVPLSDHTRLGLVGVVLRALAAIHEPGSVRFLHVVAPDAESAAAEVLPERLRAAAVDQLGDLTVIVAEDPPSVIVEQANGCGLAVLPSRPDPSLVDDVRGSGAERIVDRLSCSTILVRER